MTDQEAIDFLVSKLGTKAAVADALGVTPQVVNNWQERGISATYKPLVWAMVNDRSGNLPREWLFPNAAQRARRRPDVEAA